MIDIHCHVLPGVDDGATDIEKSLEMLRFAYDEGIDDVIATPHYHGGYMECKIDTIKDRFEILKKRASKDDKAGRVRLHLGCEIYYYPSVVEWLEKGQVATMAGSDYVLLEFGFTSEFRDIYEGVTNVVNAGYLPIVAHAERYDKLVGDMDAVAELLECGAYIQINSEVLNGGFRTKRFAKKLLKNHMVHFLATDAHGIRHRSPEMAYAAEYIANHYGEDYCRELTEDNPAKVINNEYISL